MGVSDKVNLEHSVPASVKIINELANPRYVSKDKAIPLKLIECCKGVAFINIYKAGVFFIGGNVGGGIVLVKIPDDTQPLKYRWSDPVSIKVAGLGGGFVFGAEKISSLVLLNTDMAIAGFFGGNQVSFGGSLSLAAGPVGRDANANIGVSDQRTMVPAYSYSVAKGAYIGATLEGAVLKVDEEECAKFYGKAVSPDIILKGEFTSGNKAVAELHSTLLSLNPIDNSARLGKKGSALFKTALTGDSLPPDWQAVNDASGKVYYWNSKTNETTWDKPAPVAPPPPPPAPKKVLPPNWEKFTDAATGKDYYLNKTTNNTQWEAPSF